MVFRFPLFQFTTMPKICLPLLLIGIANAISAQEVTDTLPTDFARVNVQVTDMKGRPSAGEQVFFKSDRSGKYFSGRSDAKGRFSILLSVGNKYTITLKILTDSSKHGIIDIPAPGPGEYYSEPFTVNIRFEPARQYTLDNVHFDFGKATLRPGSQAELDELVNFLNYKENVRIEIAGHTDNVGQDADNLRLSQQRAEAIRQYLLKRNIAPNRVTAIGYGATRPVADNNTDRGRQANRRTEVRIL